VARQEDKTALKDVLRTMIERGATVFDTAPSYGASEAVAGEIAAELGLTDKVFWATKVNVAGRGTGTADPAAARAQIDASFEQAQAHADRSHPGAQPGRRADADLGILKELKAQKKIRYTGVTTTSDGQYTQLAAIMRNEPIDFIGVDYAVDNRGVEEVILPVGAGAEDRCARVRAVRSHESVPPHGQHAAARVGEGDRRHDVGAVLPQVHHLAPGRHGGDAGHEPGEEHDRQHRRRHRPPARRGHAPEDGGPGGRTTARDALTFEGRPARADAGAGRTAAT
jgi:hypothetical protein